MYCSDASHSGTLMYGSEGSHSGTLISAHASVPEVNINVYKISYLRAPRFLLMNKFIT